MEKSNFIYLMNFCPKKLSADQVIYQLLRIQVFIFISCLEYNQLVGADNDLIDQAFHLNKLEGLTSG